MPSKSSNTRLENCYQRGLKLSAQDKNYDYAHEMLAQCVLHAPSSVIYAEAMLKNLRDQRSGYRKKSSFAFGQGGSRTLRKSLQQKNWSTVFQEGIDLLKANPWDVATLRAMASACEGSHYNEAELVYLKQALDAEPKSVEVNRHCARSLGRMGQFDQAIACWHRVETLCGRDAEAIQMISKLAEGKLRYPGGVPPAPSAASQVPAVSEVESQSPELAPGMALTRRQLLERALADHPQDEATYLELADLLIASEEYEAAQAGLKRAVVACGESLLLIEKLDHVRDLLARQRQAAAEANLRANQTIEQQPLRIPWLELALAAAVIGLGLQFFPSASAAAWRAIDVRNWSRTTWFVINVLAILLLVAVRFAPDIRLAWKESRLQRKVNSKSARR